MGSCAWPSQLQASACHQPAADLAPGAVTIALASNRSLSTISLSFVGRLGAAELAAAGLATSLANVTGESLLVGLASALQTLCGQVRVPPCRLRVALCPPPAGRASACVSCAARSTVWPGGLATWVTQLAPQTITLTQLPHLWPLWQCCPALLPRLPGASLLPGAHEAWPRPAAWLAVLAQGPCASAGPTARLHAGLRRQGVQGGWQRSAAGGAGAVGRLRAHHGPVVVLGAPAARHRPGAHRGPPDHRLPALAPAGRVELRALQQHAGARTTAACWACCLGSAGAWSALAPNPALHAAGRALHIPDTRVPAAGARHADTLPASGSSSPEAALLHGRCSGAAVT